MDPALLFVRHCAPCRESVAVKDEVCPFTRSLGVFVGSFHKTSFLWTVPVVENGTAYRKMAGFLAEDSALFPLSLMKDDAASANTQDFSRKKMASS